jgi:hypothetical protein
LQLLLPCRYLDWVYSRCIEYPGQLDGGTEEFDEQPQGSEEQEADGSGGGVRSMIEVLSSSGRDAEKSQREIALTGGSDQMLIRRLTRHAGLEQLR